MPPPPKKVKFQGDKDGSSDANKATKATRGEKPPAKQHSITTRKQATSSLAPSSFQIDTKTHDARHTQAPVVESPAASDPLQILDHGPVDGSQIEPLGQMDLDLGHHRKAMSKLQGEDASTDGKRVPDEDGGLFSREFTAMMESREEEQLLAGLVEADGESEATKKRGAEVEAWDGRPAEFLRAPRTRDGQIFYHEFMRTVQPPRGYDNRPVRDSDRVAAALEFPKAAAEHSNRSHKGMKPTAAQVERNRKIRLEQTRKQVQMDREKRAIGVQPGMADKNTMYMSPTGGDINHMRGAEAFPFHAESRPDAFMGSPGPWGEVDTEFFLVAKKIHTSRKQKQASAGNGSSQSMVKQGPEQIQDANGGGQEGDHVSGEQG